MIVWLWDVVHGLAPEEQRKFLKFVSGSDRAPIGGLANLRCIIQVAAARSRPRSTPVDLPACYVSCATFMRSNRLHHCWEEAPVLP